MVCSMTDLRREWLKPDADSKSIKGPLPRFIAHDGEPIVGAAPQDLKKGQMVDLSGMIFYMAEDVVTGTLLTIGDRGTLTRASAR